MTCSPLRLACLALALLAPIAAHAQAARKPHILYIIADDLGFADVGFRSPEIATPTIDQLAREGAELQQFYVQPMCTPTRAALMTGRYPMRYGLQSFVILPEQSYGIPLDEKLLPQILKEAGYSTAIIGKWHLGHADRKLWPKQRGFDYQYGALIGEIDYNTHKVHGVTDWYRNNRKLDEPGYVTTLLGKDAVRHIRQHDPAKPLFMYLAFTAPHTPFQAPKAYVDRFASIADPNRRTYAAMINAMDEQIGAVLAELSRKGMREDTLVIFHSDNGGVTTATFAGQIETKGQLPARNTPLRNGKGSLDEGGTRAVALANWPGRIKPGKVDQPMHVVDMLPTLAGRAGASLSGTKPLDGVDVWQTLSQGAPSPRTEIVYNVEMFRAALRQGDWKLSLRATLPTKVELYNIAKDPGETTNLAAENAPLVAALQKRIDDLSKEMKPSLFFQETFKSYLGRHAPGPVFPNDDAFFTQGD
ncbi:MAG: arylsulfatase [Bosea sp. (in: a-proteobacteria)]|uniref:arylsulfatase B n=1 Tax=Bosea sp. (in: a-proteobacteria) TaxID=1871050 RepID=UPI00273565C4|nr:arylsulfatase [Bosea sp. (in: a-proteobacteria)]MDP3599900.1 arylsulfatase [Bosea sp. (in: a-proteobacteria)]